MKSVFCLVLLGAFLLGCTTTRQPDGSTRVSVSLGESLGLRPKEEPKAAPVPAGGTVAKDSAATGVSTGSGKAAGEPTRATAGGPGLKTTSLANLFGLHPYDGTSRTHYPRVAVTVTDWSRNDCWMATATLWRSPTKSEPVPVFTVCWGQSVGFAVNNAANLHLFMQQTAVEHSGNVRGAGPKPPMIAIPDRQPISERQQLAFQGFVQQLLLDTGWKAGAPTNLWLVGYDANAGNAASAAVTGPGGDLKPAVMGAAQAAKPMEPGARGQLEQALACAAVGKGFEQVEAALKLQGWRPDQGIRPVALAEPVKVLGMSTQKVVVVRDGFEHTYRSYLAGVSLQQVIRAASLKLGKDGKSYGRLTKLGVLVAGAENGETTLTCTVDTEGSGA